MSSEIHPHDGSEDPWKHPETALHCAARLKSLEHSWRGSGALYYGRQGGDNWVAVTQEPTYPLNSSDLFSLQGLRRQAITGRDYSTLVSFGPGDGQHDLRLISTVTKDGQRVSGQLTYMPIDISKKLLELSIRTISNVAKIPVAVQCDFEQDGEFLSASIKSYSAIPLLYSMLGGTFANLTNGESAFFKWIRPILSKNDALLIDIPTAGAAWTVATEPRLQVNSYSDVFRRFLAYGIAQQNRKSHLSIEDNVEAILADFERRVSFSHNTNAATGAEEIRVLDLETGHTVLIFRRYRFSLLVQWLVAQGFEIAFAEESPNSIERRFGMGVILLK